MKKHIGIALATAIAAGSIYAAVASASSSSTTVTPKVVTVTMIDFHFKFSFAGPYKKGVPYIFKTVNKGHAPHNFDLQGLKAGKVISPGKTSSFTITFKKAGKFQYVCDVPRHAELGMAGRITVR
jgi:uncharacterized cupredoxin-like copper-binding protein